MESFEPDDCVVRMFVPLWTLEGFLMEDQHRPPLCQDSEEKR
jgi:hypothetical protein